jgi:hypothetical protein
MPGKKLTDKYDKASTKAIIAREERRAAKKKLKPARKKEIG